MKRLLNKSAIVTGGAEGIGEAISHKFAREGADVLIAGLPTDPLEDVARAIRAQYPDVKVATFAGDLSEVEQSKACVSAALEAFDKLDVLVNNAGIIPALKPTEEYDIDTADEIFRVNCRATFLMTRAALPALQASRGNIVNAGSEAGWNGAPNFTAYGASKAWIHAFTKGLAVEQAKHGVRANAVCPGPIDTQMTRAEIGAMDQQTQKMVVKATPMARRGTTEEMANVYAFLASDEASYVTGALLLADGGITIAHGNIGEQTPDEMAQQPEGVLQLSHEREAAEMTE